MRLFGILPVITLVAVDFTHYLHNQRVVVRMVRVWGIHNWWRRRVIVVGSRGWRRRRFVIVRWWGRRLVIVRSWGWWRWRLVIVRSG